MIRIDKQQAAAIADALLAPRMEELEAARVQREQKREKARVYQRKKRVVGILTPITSAIGIAVAHYTGQSLPYGFFFGTMLGMGIGMGWAACAMRRRAVRN